MRFRLMCLETSRETGLLSEPEQESPWDTSRKATERRPPRYSQLSVNITAFNVSQRESSDRILRISIIAS